MVAVPDVLVAGGLGVLGEPRDADGVGLGEEQPLTPHLGAVLGGVDLTRPLSDELAEELRQALLEWKVIFFRGQTGFTAEHQLALSGIWGPPEPNPFDVEQLVRGLFGTRREPVQCAAPVVHEGLVQYRLGVLDGGRRDVLHGCPPEGQHLLRNREYRYSDAAVQGV
ncbi:TauD/TfdA dioxygenase family protein [Streptomyces sp. NPDC048527]|uniref:TauD/TfdA dioxygenase family protein n=1 Tax=Streptomyces sp. NPDC048527 TaxID=3365568 RepID=UPI0037135C1F